MYVDEEDREDYWQVEEFWSKIHKQRVDDGNIIGWDLWALSPSGSEQGPQFMTTALYTSLEKMLEGVTSEKFQEYLNKAHSDKSDKEIQEMFAKTASSRNLTHQIYTKQINGTGTTDEMKVGTLMKFDVMKQTDSSYPQMEDQIFKPWHEKEIKQGKKMNWGLLEILLPMGSNSFGSHITYSMYTNSKKLAASMESWGGETDLVTELTVQDGLKTRDWKEVKVARLVMMIR